MTTINGILSALTSIAGYFGSTEGSNIAVIADNVEALGSTFEARSIAETTAANERNEALIAALEALTLSASVSCSPHVTVNCSCGGSAGTPAGTTVDQTAGTEGGTPPTGTTTPSAIDSRKCKAAGVIIDNLIDLYAGFEGTSVFSWILDYPALGGMVGTVVDAVENMATRAIKKVGGLLAQVVTLLFGGSLSGDVSSILTANRNAIICAMYNAEDAAGARSAFLDASGLTGLDQTLLSLLLPNSLMNILFFANSDVDSETVIAAYTGTVDCDSCAGVGVSMANGTCSAFTGRVVPADGQWYTLQPEYIGYWVLTLDDNIGDNPRWNVFMEFQNLTGFDTSWSLTEQIRAGSNSSNGGNNIYSGENFSAFQSALSSTCCGSVAMAAMSSFSVQVRITACQN